MLKKEIDYKWITLTGFYKIIWVNILETGKDLDWKLYSAICSINLYSTEDKLNVLQQDIIELKELREVDLLLSNYYNLIKLLPQFEWSIDC